MLTTDEHSRLAHLRVMHDGDSIGHDSTSWLFDLVAKLEAENEKLRWYRDTCKREHP